MSDIPTEILSDDEFDKYLGNFQIAKQDQLPSQITLEANIIQFPLVSYKGDTRKERTWKKEILDTGGNMETFQELKFFAPGEMKLANGLIDRKMQILAFHLWQKYGSQENGIFWFTLRGLAEFLNLAPNGKNLKKIKEALCRLRMTGIVSTNAIRKKTEEGSVVRSSEGYLNFFSNMQFIFSSSQGESEEVTKNLSFAQIHKFFINNFMRQYCGVIDLNLTLQLKQPASLGLYMVLCSRKTNENNEILFSLTSLIEDIPLDPSKSKVAEYDRVLNQAFKELTKAGVIVSVSKKEKQKSGLKGDKKLERIYFLIKISKTVREIQLSLFPDSPEYDESVVTDPILSQMISLAGLDLDTAKKIMTSKDFEMDAFQEALEVTVHNKIHGQRSVKNPEAYVKKLAERGASLSLSQKKKLKETLNKAPDAQDSEELKTLSFRPIPNDQELLVDYMINLGMWANEAKNIMKNESIDKVRLQINGWLVKHEGEVLRDHVKELAKACKSEEGFQAFNRTPFPETEFQGDPYFIEGYHKSIFFKTLNLAKEFCAKNHIESSKIYQDQ